MEYDSAQAFALYQNISFPYNLLQDGDFSRIHNPHCIAVGYYYQMLDHIKNVRLDQAQNAILNNIIYNSIAYYNNTKSRSPHSAIDTLLIKKEIEQSIVLLDSLITTKNGMPAKANGLKTDHLFHLISQVPHPIPHHFQNQSAPLIEYKLFHHPYYVPLIILLIVAIVFIYIYSHKTAAYLSSTQKVNELNQNICLLNKTIQHHENDISRLNHQLEMIRSKKASILGKGQHIYQSLKNGGTMKNISISDEQCFIDYYAYTWPDSYTKLTSPFSNLSLRHTTYLILTELGYNDKDIQQILFIKDSTIRNYRLRMNKNKLHK